MEGEAPEAVTLNRSGNLAIEVVKQDAYNVLSVLRSYVNNISGYSATSNLVPILGADASILKTNEYKIIKRFKKLASIVVDDEPVYLKGEHLQPFFDVFNTFDTRHVKLLIMCIEALSNLAKSDLLCLEEKEAPELMNKVFSEVLLVFSNVIDLKEDYLLLKIFECFDNLYKSEYGNLLSNDNTCAMYKLFLSLLSIRNRNSFFKKVFYTKVSEVLLSSFGNKEKYGSKGEELKKRVNSLYMFLSLLTGLSNRFNNLGYYTEDSYLFLQDKETMISFRSHLNPILITLLNVPANFNEFTEDMKKMSLTLFNKSIECKLVDFSNVNLIPIIQAHFAHSLYKLLFTDSITIYSLALRTFRNLYIQFRYYLKAQVELFINHFVKSVINYTTSIKKSRQEIVEMNMQFLLEMSQNTEFLTEMYLNYDCDVRCTNVFSIFAKCLVICMSSNMEGDQNGNKTDQSKTKKGTTKTTIKKTNPQYKLNTGLLENGQQNVFEPFAINTMQNIVKTLLKEQKIYTKVNENECKNYEKDKEKNNKLKEKKYKELIMNCSMIFNESKSDEWIEEVKKAGVFSKNCKEKEVALFLKYAPKLDMKKVGEYLATHKNQDFMNKVRENFVQFNHLSGIPIVMALRDFLSSFRLPGESQQIERLIEIFAKVYFISQPLANENNNKEEEEEELKMARWVIQEDFYNKYKSINQNEYQYEIIKYNDNDIDKYSNNVSNNYKDNKEEQLYNKNKEDNFESDLASQMKELSLKRVENWNDNKELYEYFLENDMEEITCKNNYKKICEYIKRTPVTMETQSTYNESISSINTEQKNILKELETDRTGLSTESNIQEVNEISESQKKEKIMMEHKPGFAYVQDYNAIFVLCYSIIMLNTDLHNQQIKNKMKVEDFIRNNRGTNDGKNFSSEFLQDIYMTIKNHEIKLHSSLTMKNTNYYDPFLWQDYVLQRQKKLSKYKQLTKTQEYSKNNKYIDLDEMEELKWELFEELIKNNMLETINQAFENCRNVEILKKIAELFWLLVRVSLKYGKDDLLNKVYQMDSIDVSYSLGYKCQISISFILNVMATASEKFDEKSWSKSLDIVTRLYCLNLLPGSFAALDRDSRLYSSNTNELSVPSIRFKRITDKKSSNWLVGLSYLVPFGKGSSNPEGIKNIKEQEEEECEETFLFLFDLQSGTKDLLENKFFDVYLLRNKFSPVYSSEDESTINNVTKTLSNESDREELLPPILTYINLRLAFLNIYKLDELFMGTILTSNVKSFKIFMSVIIKNIFEEVNEENQKKDTARERDNFGNILDPNYGELERFRDKITSIFSLGIFSRLLLEIMTGPMKEDINKIKEEKEQIIKLKEKRELMLKYFIEVFYRIGRRLSYRESVESMPTKESIYNKFNLNEKEEIFVNKMEEKEELDQIFINQSCFMMINMTFWLVDFFNYKKDIESPTSQIRLKKSYIEQFNNYDNDIDKYSNNVSNNYKDNKEEQLYNKNKEDDKMFKEMIELSSWLLHMLINFDNKMFNKYQDPIEKLLYNLADSFCISKNIYLVQVVLCGVQRMVNHYLPFGGDLSRKTTSKTSGSIVTLLLRRSKCLSWNSEYVAKLTSQTLLSISLYSNTKIQTNKSSITSINQRKDLKQVKENENKEQYTENLLAIQLLIEFNSFANNDNKQNLEHLWLLSLHSLSIIFSIGPKEISNEAIKGLNKLLLQQPYPETQCTYTSQVARIFDYILSPMLTLNFYYPLPFNIQTPLDEIKENKTTNKTNYHLCNPFQKKEECKEGQIWMSEFMHEYINNFAFKDFEDLASRKASATNLICHALLSKLTKLTTENQEEVKEEYLKSSSSNLECLLYDNKDHCGNNCIKKLVVVTQYVLNVIIPTNGEIHTGISRDTYLETLKNFILVLLTSPELKVAPETCLNHFKNQTELNSCLELLKEQVEFENIKPGEQVLSSLLAHTFSTSDSLKNLFLEVMKVVFPKIENEPPQP